MRALPTILALLVTLPAAALDLAGRVLTANGKAAAGAHVYVFTALPRSGVNTVCPSCYRDCGKREKVASDGAFRLRNLDGTLKFRLLAVADGYEPAFSEYVASGPVTLTLAPRDVVDTGRLVRGRVVDPKGKPVVGAVVEPRGLRMGRRIGYGAIRGIDLLSITNDDGEFALRVRDSSNTLDVRVRARNLAPEIARELATNTGGQTIRVDVGATISGRLVRNGKPQPGVLLGFDHKDHRSSNYLGQERIGTDEKGFFVITGLGPGEEYLVFLDDGYRAADAETGMLVKAGADGSSLNLGDIELRP